MVNNHIQNYLWILGVLYQKDNLDFSQLFNENNQENIEIIETNVLNIEINTMIYV